MDNFENDANNVDVLEDLPQKVGEPVDKEETLKLMEMSRHERLSLAVAFIGAKSGQRANSLQPKLIHRLSLWVEHGDDSYLEVNNV